MNAETLFGRTLLVVAHPDDETVAAGALLQRTAEPIVVFCTDGAPRDEFFWSKHGSRLRYARLRQEEAQRALALAGVRELVFLTELANLQPQAPQRPPATGARADQLFIDQELHCAVPEALARLSDMVRRYRPQALLTLAYEGGHPDHDVCSFLASVLGHDYGLPVWEVPLYHRAHTSIPGAAADKSLELIYQRFLLPNRKEEVLLEITPDELAVKREMLAAYGSQHPFLSSFDPARERFRPQQAYDYSQPPHPGRLNYEAWQWPITGTQVSAALVDFLAHRRRIA